MEQRRLNMADIVIGEPLLWDVYGEGRKLLMSKGHIVETEHQVEGLLERGLYIDAHYVPPSTHAHQEAPIQKLEIPSVVRLINGIIKRLERMFYNLQNETDAQTKLLELSRELMTATRLNPDIAAGCILLNQAAGHYAVRHGVDSAIIAIAIARTLQTEEEDIASLTAAALTMNLGMLRQHDQLQAKSDALSEKDRDIILKHPQESVNLLQQAGVDNTAWLAHVLHHHENDDGSGYPQGAAAGALPQLTKILAFADRYCACISSRQYRSPMLPTAALREIFFVGGKARDPLLAAYFIRHIGTYPPGTFVRLQNGEIGVVTGHGHTPATPVVHALIGPRGAPLSFPIRRDTSKELYAVREALQEDASTLRFSLHQLWGDEANL